MSGGRWGSGFSAVARFVAEVEAAAAGNGQLRAGYVLAGDEVFLLDRCRAAVLKGFVPDDLRDFCLSDLDLASTSIFEVLDRAQTPSLMSPFQVIFVRNVRQLYTRGAKKEEFAALDRYFRSPNPQAVLLFVADFLRIPSDARRMDMDDKNRYERLTETLGEHCGMVELARVGEEDAMRWVVSTAQAAGVRVEPDAARELVDSLGADMMLASSELEKLLLYTSGRGRITLASPDPFAAPLIDPNLLSEPQDVLPLVRGIRLARRVFSAPAFEPYRAHESTPGASVESDADLISYIRAQAYTVHHPVSTCRMGADAMAVVDPQLRVIGLEGLRVADAAVFPSLIGGNTNAAVVMVAEKAADMILGRAPPAPASIGAATARRDTVAQ